MTTRLAVWCAVLLCIGLVSMVSGCAGKGETSPRDVEAQAFDDLRAAISEAVADPASEAEAIRLVGVLEADLEVLRDSIAARSQRSRELNADYDTTRAEFEAFLDSAQAAVRANRQRVSEAHHAFLDAVSAEERAQIDKVRSKAMAAAIKSMQAI